MMVSLLLFLLLQFGEEDDGEEGDEEAEPGTKYECRLAISAFLWLCCVTPAL